MTEWKRQLLERAGDVFDGGAVAGKSENAHLKKIVADLSLEKAY